MFYVNWRWFGYRNSDLDYPLCQRDEWFVFGAQGGYRISLYVARATEM